MEIILLGKVDNLGELGDKVDVRPGYARNYLIPTGKAKFATAKNIAEFEALRSELELKAQEQLKASQSRAEKLSGLEVKIIAKVGGEGKLFGSVGTADITDAIAALGMEVEKSEVRLPQGPLRQTGEHAVELHLHADVNVEIKVIIEGEE